MSAVVFASLVVSCLASELAIVCPNYPPLAIRGGDVVAGLELSRGSVRRMIVLHGDEPFTDPTRTALAQWSFPKEREDRPVLVVVNFRDPFLNLTDTGKGIAFVAQSRAMRTSSNLPDIPSPALIVDPLYPSESLVVQGAIVLHLQLTTSGLVERIEVIQELHEHTQACIDAVKKWKFMPAWDEQGKPIASDAFAVCVYRPLSRPADR